MATNGARGLSNGCRGAISIEFLEAVHSDSRWTYVGANPKPTKAELVGHARVRRFCPRQCLRATAPRLAPRSRPTQSGNSAPNATVQETGACRWPVRAANLRALCFPDVRPTRYVDAGSCG